MANTIKGSCNWCGSCCGYNFHKPAIPYAFFAWDKQHPGLGLPLIKLIKKKIGENAVNILSSTNITGAGKIDFYLSKNGLQTSKTDNTCPFFNKETKECKIWNTKYIPNICKQTPQNLSKKQIEKWPQNHPGCGFSWKE